MQKTITPEAFMAMAETVLLFDVRRKEIYEASNQIVAGAVWRDPADIEEWMVALPHQQTIVVYCVHGHQVSHGVVDRLQAEGLLACLIEGGIEGLKTAGGNVVSK